MCRLVEKRNELTSLYEKTKYKVTQIYRHTLYVETLTDSTINTEDNVNELISERFTQISVVFISQFVELVTST